MKGDDGGTREDEWGWKWRVLMANCSSTAGGDSWMRLHSALGWEYNPTQSMSHHPHDCVISPTFLLSFLLCCPIIICPQLSILPSLPSSTALLWGLSPGCRFGPNHPQAEQREDCRLIKGGLFVYETTHFMVYLCGPISHTPSKWALKPWGHAHKSSLASLLVVS